MFPAIGLLQQKEYELNQLQKNIIQPINNLFEKNVFIDGGFIQGVSLLSASTTSINHKLGRKYVGYFITKLNANSVIWVGADTETETYLKLNCSANCTVDIWVF